MTFIDLLFIIIFIAVMTVGFFKGMIKVLISIAAFYLAIVIASLYYRFLAIKLMEQSTTSPYIAQVISYFILVFILFVLLVAAGVYTFRYVRVPGKLAYIDKIIGMGLGVVLGGLVISILAMLLSFLFIQNRVGYEGSIPLGLLFQRSTERSWLVGFCMNNLLPAIYAMVAPVIPPEASIIFGRR